MKLTNRVRARRGGKAFRANVDPLRMEPIERSQDYSIGDRALDLLHYSRGPRDDAEKILRMALHNFAAEAEPISNRAKCGKAITEADFDEGVACGDGSRARVLLLQRALLGAH